MRAYHVPPAAAMIKLDAMENPYAWPEALKQVWHEKLDAISINRYPDPAASQLKERLRELMAIPADISIMLGNGSDELIQILAVALAQTGRHYLAPEPGFVMYRRITETLNVGYCGVPLMPPDFALDQAAMLAEISRYQPVLIFIAWPNNPTGNLFDKGAVLEVIKHAPGLVVIDEAYHAFSGQSFISHLGEFENLLVMRTFSKSGLAGIRLGYLLGQASVLEELEKIRLPYNINSLTQATAEFILGHAHVLEEQYRRIRAGRESLFAGLNRMPGIQAWPSAANFILFRTKNSTADEVFTGLKQRGILIKNLHGSHPLLENCLRVTVGTEEENQSFLEAMQQL
jgi:histidinol-phosphate aminotransferase